MKFSHIVAFCSFFALAPVFAAELTRTVELSAEQSSAVFAVPNGFSFTRAYATDAEGESVPVSVGEPTTMNHVTLIPLAVDLSASPSTSTSSLNLTVVFEDNGPLFTGRPAKVMREAIKEKVANPEDVPTTQYVAPTRSRLKLAVAPQSLDDEPSAQQIDGADVLILSPHDNVTLWQQYATFRKSTAVGAGLTFKVVDLNDVYAAYPWTGDSPSVGVRNAAESIHKYLRENRDNLGLSYVIFGGSWIDAQSIDADGYWLNSSNQKLMFPTGAYMTLENCVPGVIAHSKQDAASDMFYACLDLSTGQIYPWCVGDSTEYFKVQDKVEMPNYDRGVDIIVSRLPLKPVRIGDKDWTSAELMDAFIGKLKRVEGIAESANFSGTGRLGNLWHNLADPYGAGIPVDASLPNEHEFYDDVLNLFDANRDKLYNNGETPSRKMLREHVSKYYPIKEVDSVSPRAWTKGYATSDEAKVAYFAKDRDFGSMESHGYAYFAGSEGFISTSSFYAATGITLLNDFTMLCATGQQNYIGESWQGYTHSVPCLGEAAVDAPFGGAIASLNNSRDGLVGGENTLSYRIYHEGARKFLHQGGNAGETWLESHIVYAKSLGSAGDPGGNLVLVEHTLFGDPLVKSQAFANKDKAFESASYSVSGVEAYVDATASGDLTLSGSGRLKVLQTLSIGGTSFTVENGVEGGVGQKVAFTGAEKGAVTINTQKRFYLGGVENCSAVVVNGSNVIVDCDNLGEGLSSITFNMTPDATCTLRGLKKGALAGINLVVNGGTLVFETSDVLNQNRVDLNGATLIVAVDPALGSGHPSAESMNGIFYGSGKLVCQRGTEALKKWSLQSSSIVIESFGELEPTFEYSGVVGSSPSGWFNAWKGEDFDNNKAVLSPNGFVRYVEDGHHPYADLPGKTMFTLSLYADLSSVKTKDNAILLSLGTCHNYNQILLNYRSNKIYLDVVDTAGNVLSTANLDYPGNGYHLYTICRADDKLTLSIDESAAELSEVKFTLGTGIQIGSQFGKNKGGCVRALGMAVAALRGYDVVIDSAEMAALVREFPAACTPFTITKPILFAQANEATATLVNAVFAAEASLKVAKGRVEVPAGTTVTVPTLEFADGSSTDDRAVVAVAGTLNAGEIVLNGRGTQTLDLCGGRLVATDDWKVSLPINVTADSTLDSNGHDLILSGSISGSANLTITGAGSVTILSDISNFSGKITVASSVAKFGVRKEYVESRHKIVFETRPATLIVALSAEQLQSSYTASGYSGYVEAGSKIVFTDYDGYVYQKAAGTTVFAPWRSIAAYDYDGIEWKEVYLPYERGKWESLANWRTLWTNGSATNTVQKYTSGLAPQLTGCERWDPIILNGDEFEGDELVNGFHYVHADKLEGWNPRIGVYNGVHLDIGEMYRFRADVGQYFKIGQDSRITIGGMSDVTWSTGTMSFYVNSEDGLVFKTNIHNSSFEYHLGSGATVKFEQGLNSGAHKIMACEAQLSEQGTKTKFNIYAIKLFDFNGKGSSADITLGDNALILKDATGRTIPSRKFANSLAMYKDALENGVGGYTLLQGDAGLYLAYIDYADESPTTITISGLQTNLDLTTVPEGVRIRIVGAWGYFDNSNMEITKPIEFVNTGLGKSALRITNGYSANTATFAKVVGDGTFEVSYAPAHTVKFVDVSDYTGSLIVTNGLKLVIGNGDALNENQSIHLAAGTTAKLKNCGVWVAGVLTSGNLVIDGTLNCNGKADIICMPGITGVGNIKTAEGYTKSLLTLSDNNGNNSRVCRVFVHSTDSVPTAEGQLGLGVTDKTITLPSFDMGEYTLRVLGRIVVGEDAVVTAPSIEFVVNEQGERIGSLVAAAKIGDTYYGSFAKAAQAAQNGDVIELLTDVSHTMEIGQMLRVRLNGHTLTYEESDKQYTVDTEGDITEIRCSTQVYTITYHIKYPVSGFETVELEPKSFVLEELPLTLPKPTEENAVFHGWYWSDDFSGDPIATMPANFPRIELHLYGYFNTAVASVNGVLCETWEEAFAEQARTHYSIDVIGAPQLPDGYMVERGTLVKVMATLQVGESKIDYSSLLEAYNASKIETDPIIILKADAPSALTIGLNETLRVKHNGFTLSVVNANPDTHIIRATLDANTGVTTYRSLLAVAKIGANRYATLSDAVANLGAADTIEILADIGSENVALTKNTILNILTDCTFSAILSGPYSLTKTGAGTLSISAAQTLTGDFIVAEGKVEASAAVRAKNADAYVEVRKGASLKFTTNVQLDCQYAFKLAGDGVNHEGALVFSALESWYNAQIKSITLTDDATIKMAMSAGGAGLIGSRYSATSIELNGHTLTKKGAMPFFLYNTTVSDSSVEKTGKVIVEEGTLEIVQYPGMTYVTTFNAPVVGNLNIQAPICVNVPANRTWTITAATIGNTASTATLAEGASLVATTGLFTSVTTDLVEKKVVKTTNASHDTYTLETKTYTVTVPSVENTTYLVQVNGEAVEIRNGTITVNHGDRVVVTYSAAEGYAMTEVIKTIESVTTDSAIDATDVSPVRKTFTVNVPLTTGLAVAITPDRATDIEGGKSIVADYSETVTVTYTANGDYILSGTLEQTFTYSASTQTAVAPTATLAAAKIGTTLYATINDALAHASDGDIVWISGDIPETHKLVDGQVVAKVFYAVTLGAHANAEVVGLPENSVEEDDPAITFTVSPAASHNLIAVKANGVALEAADGVYMLKVSTDTEITIETAIKTFTVTAPTGEGLTVSATSATGNYGETVTITYTLAENYILKSGSLTQEFTYRETAQSATLPTVVLAAAKIGGTLYETIADAIEHASDGDIVWISGDIPETHKKTDDGKVVAKVYYTVTVIENENATVSELPASVREDADPISFTVTPSTGYHVVSVLANDVELGTSGSYELTIVKNTTISVTTAINTYKVNVPSVAHTTVSHEGYTADEDGYITVNHGDTLTFVFTPDAEHGYEFVGENVTDRIVVGPVTSAIESVGSSSITVPTLKQYTVKIAQVANATYTVDGDASTVASITVDWGSSHAIVYTAADGYEFTDGTTAKEFALADIRDNATVGLGLETSKKRYTVSIVGLEDGVSATINSNAYTVPITVNHGDSVSIAYSVEGPYVLSKTSDVIALVTADTTIEAPTKTAAVAKVGSIYYATLKAAVDSGVAEIEVIANIDSENVALPKDLSLNVLNDCTFSAVLSGAHSLTKTGAGTLTINAAQTLTGDFIVAEGKVESRAAVREKNANAYVEVRSGASLKFTTNVQEDCHYAFKLAGDGVEHEGALIFGAAQSWYSSQVQSITLTGDATITADWTGEGGTGLVGSGYAETAIELNGYVLTKKGSRPFLLVHTTVSDSVGTGKIYVAEGVVELANGDCVSIINVPVEAAANAGLDVQAPIAVNVPANKTYTITAQRVNSGVTNRTATLADGATLIATTGLFATANVTSSVATAEVLSTMEGVTSGFTKFWAELPRTAYEVTDAQIAELGEFSQGSIGEIAVSAPSMAEGCALTAPDGYYAWRKDASTVYVAKKTNSISVKTGVRNNDKNTPIRVTDTDVGGFSVAGVFWNNTRTQYTGAWDENHRVHSDYIKLTDGNGELTNAKLAYYAANTYFSQAGTENGNARLTASYFDDGATAGTTQFTIAESSQSLMIPEGGLTLPAAPCNRGWQVRLEDIPYEVYDVYIYLASDVGTVGNSILQACSMALSVDGGESWKWYAGDHDNHATIAAAQSNTWKADPYSTGTLTEGTNYMRIRVSKAAFGTTGKISTLDISHGPRTDNTTTKIRFGLAGIQIVKVDDDGVYTRVADPTGMAENDERRNWTAPNSWKNSKGELVDWPTSGFRYAYINADEVSSIRLDSAIEANMVFVTSSDETYTLENKEFKFLTKEPLNEVATEKVNAPYILKAPVDATGFCGDLYLQSRINGMVSLGSNTHITFVAMTEGEETTAYPYNFNGTVQPIRKIGPGTFVVPESMYTVPFNVTAGYIRYVNESSDEKTISGAITGNGGLTIDCKKANFSSGSNSIKGAINVNEGIIKLNTAEKGIQGSLNIARGATAVAQRSDSVKWDGSASLNIRGNLDMGTRRWTLRGGNTVNIYSGSVISGTAEGVDGGGHLDLNNGTGKLHMVTDTDSIGTVAEISAIIAAGSTGTIEVDEGLTLKLTATTSCSNSNRNNTLKKTGAGTIEVSANFSGMTKFNHTAGKMVLKEGANLCATEISTGAVISGTGTISTLTLNDGSIIDLDAEPSEGDTLISATTLTVNGTVKLHVNGIESAKFYCEKNENSIIAKRYTFKVKVPTVENVTTVIPTGYTVDEDGYIAVAYGDSVTFTFTPNIGYQLGSINSVTVENVTEMIDAVDATSVVATKKRYTVAIPMVEKTTASVEGYEIDNGFVTVEHGDSITIKYAANEGYQIVGDNSLVVENITDNLSPAAPSLSITYAPNQMLYCFHLDGNTDNVGIGTGTLELSQNGTAATAWSDSGAFESSGAVFNNWTQHSYVLADATNGIVPSDDGWTISFWVNMNGMEDKQAHNWKDIAGFNIGDKNIKFEKGGDTTLHVYWNGGTSLTSIKYGNDLRNGWFNITVKSSSDKSGIDVYFNGVLVGCDCKPSGNIYGNGINRLTKLVLGCYDLASGTRPAGALLDEVAIFNTALTEKHIAWLSENAPSQEVFDEDIEIKKPTPGAFGYKVLGLAQGDTSTWTDHVLSMTSHVGRRYDNVNITLLVNLNDQTPARFLSANTATTEGGTGHSLDLKWEDSKVKLGYDNDHYTTPTTEIEHDLHLITMSISWNGGISVYIDGASTPYTADPSIKWTGGDGWKPTGTFTYQGDIKSITLDFSSSNAVSGLDALPKFTQGDKPVTNLATISEILEMTGKSISDAAFEGTGLNKTVAADVTMGSLVETGDANTIGITVGTSLDLPNGEVTILVEDPNNKGKFVDLSTVDPLVGPTADPTLHDAGNKLVVPISSLLGGAKSRLFKLKVSPKK